jgi:cytochrome c oxidase cbb3-type subunit 1
VRVTIPYLESRSIGGGLMTLGHLVFAFHFMSMALRYGRKRVGPALFHKPSEMLAPAGSTAVVEA